MKKSFPVVVVCHPWKTGTTEKEEYCYNILYNSISFGLLKESQKVRNLGVNCLRLNLRAEVTGTICRHTAGIFKCISARQNTR